VRQRDAVESSTTYLNGLRGLKRACMDLTSIHLQDLAEDGVNGADVTIVKGFNDSLDRSLGVKAAAEPFLQLYSVRLNLPKYCQ
jgi:hypothetical protein